MWNERNAKKKLPSAWTGLSLSAPVPLAGSAPAAACRGPACWRHRRPMSLQLRGHRYCDDFCTTQSCLSKGAFLCREHVPNQRKSLSQSLLHRNKTCFSRVPKSSFWELRYNVRLSPVTPGGLGPSHSWPQPRLGGLAPLPDASLQDSAT